MENFLRDPNVVRALPRDGEVLAVKRHGDTSWSTGYRVVVWTEDKSKLQNFFLKILDREDAAEMAEGEYESAAALHKCIPENACPALAWGTLATDPKRAFFLTEYRDLREGLATPKDLAQILQRMHLSTSFNGKFGFPVRTFKGYTPIDNTWCDTWEEYFTRTLRNDIAWEQYVRGLDSEFNEVAEEFVAKVVPRLLRPLETGGRRVEPVLIHGDLWDGNIEIDKERGTPFTFDACCCYGHREFELATMNTSRYKMGSEYIHEYINLVGESEPKEDFWDRLKLYTMHQDIIVAGLWPNWVHLRGAVKEQMRELLAKYPGGIDG